MNNTYDSSLEARLRDIEWKIGRLKDSLLTTRVLLAAVALILVETIVFNLVHFSRGP